jgi:hypothetical protein
VDWFGISFPQIRMEAESRRQAEAAARQQEKRMMKALDELMPMLPQLTLEQCMRALEVE